MDAVATYLNRDLTREIYLQPLEGIPIASNTVWHLKMALYKLKQARLEWYQGRPPSFPQYSATHAENQIFQVGFLAVLIGVGAILECT